VAVGQLEDVKGEGAHLHGALEAFFLIVRHLGVGQHATGWSLFANGCVPR
jgi:hypothetical protein